MFRMRLAISLLVAAAFLPGTLAQAQYPPDSGEYLILSAQYGTERNHVDVTSRLKELARQDQLFRMGNNSFGVDPDYGQVKVLRIYARMDHSSADGVEAIGVARAGVAGGKAAAMTATNIAATVMRVSTSF